MTSVLNVDTIAAKDGTSPVALTKQSAAKAWVSFNGSGTVAIRGSEGVSSISDNGAGDYSINYTNSMSGDYAASGFAGEDGEMMSLRSGNSYPPASSDIRIATKNYSGTATDRIYNLCIIHGDLA